MEKKLLVTPEEQNTKIEEPAKRETLQEPSQIWGIRVSDNIIRRPRGWRKKN